MEDRGQYSNMVDYYNACSIELGLGKVHHKADVLGQYDMDKVNYNNVDRVEMLQFHNKLIRVINREVMYLVIMEVIKA